MHCTGGHHPSSSDQRTLYYHSLYLTYFLNVFFRYYTCMLYHLTITYFLNVFFVNWNMNAQPIRSRFQNHQKWGDGANEENGWHDGAL